MDWLIYIDTVTVRCLCNSRVYGYKNVNLSLQGFYCHWLLLFIRLLLDCNQKSSTGIVHEHCVIHSKLLYSVIHWKTCQKIANKSIWLTKIANQKGRWRNFSVFLLSKFFKNEMVWLSKDWLLFSEKKVHCMRQFCHFLEEGIKGTWINSKKKIDLTSALISKANHKYLKLFWIVKVNTIFL